ncbi:MAG: Pr6Pr family membrane protein [Solirubrobacteraceae bacterium]|nr:Pr6Pr family membrane protein [Solirubrobacteraceae bacterium]
MRSALAYRANLLLALVAGSGLLLRLVLTIVHPDSAPDNPELLTRLVRFFSYFTIQSNIAVLVAALAVLRLRDLHTPGQRALRLAALVGISVTGIVYVTILAGDSAHNGVLSELANALLHYVCPPLAVLVWLGLGPWPGLSLGDLGRMMVWPVAWIVYTLIRGAIVDWYPYGFIDADLHSYGEVAVNVGAIVVFAIGLGAAYATLDRWRARNAGSAAR